MLANLLDPLDAAAPGLEHLAFLQGTKAYGAHLGPIPLPARESLPRHPHESFYSEQEDYVRAHTGGQALDLDDPAAADHLRRGLRLQHEPRAGDRRLLREEGRTLDYPGGLGRVLQATDAELLSRAFE
jgi:hypothetical protein